MGRGASTLAAETILYGESGPRGVDMDSLLEIELTGKQKIVLRALWTLQSEHPSAPGFETYDINEAAEPFEQQAQEWLALNSVGTVLSSLQKKGLVARSTGCFKGAGGIIIDTENGWILSAQGGMLATALNQSCPLYPDQARALHPPAFVHASAN